MQARELKRCRVCASKRLWPYLDLGLQPLANALRAPDAQDEELRVPLAVQLCETCGLSQLTHVVPPDVLYTNYAFRSGTTIGWHKHCRRLARILDGWYFGKGLAIDIGANDGTMLRYLNTSGYSVLGVDPSPCADDDIPFYAKEWSDDTAKIIEATDGQATIVTAQNVVGHVDDVLDFLAGIKRVLAPHGTAVIEVPIVTSLVDATAFDTIYHEHLSYWALTPLRLAALRVELEIVGAEALRIHNGSMRVFLRHPQLISSSSVSHWEDWEKEWGLKKRRPYENFAQRTQLALGKLCLTLGELHAQGQRVWAYGASAKLAVLLNALAVPNAVERVLDDTKAKQGKRLPGLGIPISAPPERLDEPDVLLVGSRNWLADIRTNASQRGFRGRLLIPLPEPRLL